MDRIIGLVTFDPIPEDWVEKLNAWLYSLPETDPLNANFEASGYESLFMITNIGFTIWICFFNIIVAVISYILGKYNYRCRPRWQKKLHVFYWNSLIRLYMSLFQDLALLSILNLDTLEWESRSSSEVYSYILSVVSIVLVSVLPIVFTAILYRNIAVWNQEEFLNNFGALFGDADI